MSQSAAGGNFQQRWKKISRRIRVPLGFLFAVVYFWFARPSAGSLLASLVLVAPGILLRACHSANPCGAQRALEIDAHVVPLGAQTSPDIANAH